MIICNQMSLKLAQNLEEKIRKKIWIKLCHKAFENVTKPGHCQKLILYQCDSVIKLCVTLPCFPRGESSGDSYRGTGRWRDGEDPPRMAKLSRGIWNHFVKGQQKPGTLDQKISLWEELERVLGPRLRGTTHAFGSTLNGFALDSRFLGISLEFYTLCILYKLSSTVNIGFCDQPPS